MSAQLGSICFVGWLLLSCRKQQASLVPHCWSTDRGIRGHSLRTEGITVLVYRHYRLPEKTRGRGLAFPSPLHSQSFFQIREWTPSSNPIHISLTSSKYFSYSRASLCFSPFNPISDKRRYISGTKERLLKKSLEDLIPQYRLWKEDEREEEI